MSVQAAQADTVFALIWLSPSPQILRSPNNILAACFHRDLTHALLGRASPHVVHISAGRTAAVVELIPLTDSWDNIMEFASLCEDLLGNHDVLRNGAVSRCVLSVSCCVSSAGAAPPRPPAEWIETSMLACFPFLKNLVAYESLSVSAAPCPAIFSRYTLNRPHYLHLQLI